MIPTTLFKRTFYCLCLAGIGSCLLVQCNLRGQVKAEPILFRLHIGLSLDSAKWFHAHGGWQDIVILAHNSDSASVLYRNIRIPSIKTPFIATLNFKNRRLFSFSLVDQATMLTMPNPLHKYERQDYHQLVKALEAIHGRPTFSGVTPIHSMGRIDSTFQTSWAKGVSFYSVQFDQYNGIRYIGSIVGKR